MKKIFIIIAIVLGVAVTGMIVLMPAEYAVSNSIIIKGNANAATRILATDSVWAYFAGQAGFATDSGVQMKKYRFRVLQSSVGQVAVGVYDNNNKETISQVLILQRGIDSLLLHWQTRLTSTVGFFDRLNLYFDQQQLTKEQALLLSKMNDFLERKESIYGYNIVPGNMTDSIVLTTSFISTDKPDLATVYAQINLLEQYASKNIAVPTNAPMLYIQKNPEGVGYKTQVALPINKWLDEYKGLSCKRMVLGRNLTAYVKGPQTEIDRAYKAMYQYVSDYNISMPGIPFEVLITNRMAMKDSNIWETKIYFPSMK